MPSYDPTFDEALRRYQARAIDISQHPYLAPWKTKIETPEFFPFVNRHARIRFCVVPYSARTGYQPKPTLNAFVFRHDGQPIIAVHLELILQCHLLAFHLFAGNAFWPEIGDSSREVSEVSAMPAFDAYDNDSHARACSVVPQCTVRQQASGLLFSLMLAFLFQHEKYHVLRGHLDYSVSDGATGLTESSTDIEGMYGTERAVRIAQEYDADSCAIANIVKSTAVDADLAKAYPMLDVHRIHARIAALAACGVLTLIDRAYPTPRHESLAENYPPTPLREVAALATAVMTVRSGPNRDSADKMFEGIGRDLRMLYRVVPYAADIDAHEVLRASGVSGEMLIKDAVEVEKIWREYADGHQPFAYVDVRRR